jgi:hypothetical protein
MEGKPTSLRVLNFYSYHPELILKLAKDKLVTGFFVYYSFWLIILLLVADRLSLLVNRLVRKKILRKVFITGIAIGLFLAAIRIFDTLWGNEYLISEKLLAFIKQVNRYFVWGLIVLLGLLLLNFRQKLLIRIPFIFTAVIAGFAGMVVLTCLPIQELRFVKVIDYVFLLIAIVYLFEYLAFVADSIKGKASETLNVLTELPAPEETQS